MSLVGFRIDDRLLHGQVVENWIEALRPGLIVVANDRAAADAFTQELYAAALPPGVRLIVAPLPAAWAAAREFGGRVFMIAATPADALALVELGLDTDTITIGGLHHASGKERVLDYVYLDGTDRDHLRRLSGRGMVLVAQDVPKRRAIDLAPLLDADTPPSPTAPSSP